MYSECHASRDGWHSNDNFLTVWKPFGLLQRITARGISFAGGQAVRRVYE